jgi:ABC-type bacteriocin/lantibiotic exporter with double-glycine peptidase domain
MIELEDIAKFFAVLAVVCLSISILSVVGFILVLGNEEAKVIYVIVIALSLGIAACCVLATLILRRTDNAWRRKNKLQS